MALPDSLTQRPSKDCQAFNCKVEKLHEAMISLRQQYAMMIDLTAVDHGVDANPRFEMIYHLFSPTTHEYIRVASFCASSTEPTAPTMTDLWPTANWHERECFDLMGIRFEGHPELKRILMWEGYPYHPLRKDFPLSGIETPLPAADVAEETGAKAIGAPMMGGPFTAKHRRTMHESEPRAKDETWTEKKEKPQ